MEVPRAEASVIPKEEHKAAPMKAEEHLTATMKAAASEVVTTEVSEVQNRQEGVPLHAERLLCVNLQANLIHTNSTLLTSRT